MVDAIDTPLEKSRERSPSFPFISLSLALKRLQSVEAKFGRHPVPNSKAGLAWSLQSDSSQAQQTLAALRAYGLMIYEGPATDRRASISELGRTFLRAQQDSIKLAAAREAVLKPRIFSELFAEWGAKRPPDAVCLDDLVIKRKFTQAAADRLLRIYDKNIQFAQLTDNDESTAPANDSNEEGEAQPRQESKERTASDGGGQAAQLNRMMAISDGLAIASSTAPSADMFSEVFSIDSGSVALSWPKALTIEEAEEVEAWLGLIVRKIRRRAQGSAS